jgi:hypothetical protein
MTYADWVVKGWKLDSAKPELGSTRFGLSVGGILKFDGPGTLGSTSNVYLNGATTPWGENCVFSSDLVTETVTGTHRSTGQPFTITRIIGQKTQTGTVFHRDPVPRPGIHRRDDDDPCHHGAGSGCGVWTANDG